MGLDRVSGNANSEIAVTAHGKSERELIATLGGKGAMHLAEGAVRGIDLAGLLRNPVSLIDAQSQSDQKTAFSDLGGSFTITNGIVENRDLALKSPVLTVTGAGKIDLPQRTVDYRIEPPPGLPVALLVVGPWDHLSYRPQPTEALLKDPGKAVQGLKGLLQNPTGQAPAGQAPTGSTGTATKPADLLKGLLAPKP
jgi:AsmA protein